MYGDKLSILLVDDDPDTLSSVTRILRLDDYHIDTAASIAEMMDRKQWAGYFAILLDRKLPDGLAEDILPELKQLAPDAAVLIATGHADLDSSIVALRHGAEDYLLKPINPDALRTALIRIAERNRREHELARTQQALAEQKKILQSIFDCMHEGVVVVDENAKFLQFNSAAERITGLGPVDIPPEEWSEHYGAYLPDQTTLCPTEELPVVRAIRGEEVTDVVMFLRHAQRLDGIWCNVSASPLRDGTGAVRGGVAVFRDISERRALEKAVLDIAAEEQRRIGQDLHDGIGQELTGLNLYAAGLVSTLGAPEATRLLEDAEFLGVKEMAVNLSEGLTETNRHLKNLARGIIPVEIEAKGLMAALDGIASSINGLMNIPCIFDCAEPVEVHDNVTATNLYRIAQEAINNALQHSQANEIRVALRQQEGRIILEVIDNGVGIDSGFASRSDGVAAPEGMGLRIMAYRAGLIGATLNVGPGTGRGTIVRCAVRPENSVPRK